MMQMGRDRLPLSRLAEPHFQGPMFSYMHKLLHHVAPSAPNFFLLELQSLNCYKSLVRMETPGFSTRTTAASINGRSSQLHTK